MRRRELFYGSIIIALFLLSNQTYAQLTPQEAIEQMGRGINIGNTLEPPDEGGWNNPPVEEYYFDDYDSVGFSTIRIPISWYNHAETSLPYTVDETWMDRVAQIVDWGLSRKLIIIINAHHEDWLEDNPTPENLERFDSIWSQIAVRFQDRSDSLLFEMINEPYPMPLSTVDSLNARVLSIIRKTNPTRIVLFSGHQWSGSWDLLQAAIPEDDYLMGYFHSYDPYMFGLEGEGIWGSAGDVNAVKSNFDRVSQWVYDTGIPAIIGEFGAVVECDFNSRSYHYATYVEQAMEHNIPYMVWDDGGWFRIYEREDREWNYLKDIVTNFSVKNPTKIKALNQEGLSALLTWENRTTENDSIFIERGPTPIEWSKIASLTNDISEFTDVDVEEGSTYYYRVVAYSVDTTDLLSYPVNVKLEKPEAISDHNTQANALNIFPNPASDIIQISLENNELISVLYMYSLDGQLIDKIIPEGKKASILIKHLTTGTYFIKVKTKSGSYRTRFIKQ